MRARPGKHTLFFSLVTFALLSLSTFLKVHVDLGAAEAGSPWLGSSPWTESLLATLSLEQKVGQLIAARVPEAGMVPGDSALQQLSELVASGDVGGVVITPGQRQRQASLTAALQAQAPVPLLVSEDLEWPSTAVATAAEDAPSMLALGATREASYAYAVGHAAAQEARARGAYQVFAPVAAVDQPGTPSAALPSFGAHPALVAEMTAAYVQGLQDGGVIATIKHFPGHARPRADSSARQPAPFDSVQLAPFSAAVAHGVLSVQVGHPTVSQERSGLRSRQPVMSPNGWLRRRLGFEGLIVADVFDVEQRSASSGLAEAALKALAAGTDVIILSKDIRATREAVVQAVRSGRLSERRLDASVQRVLRAKEWIGLRSHVARGGEARTLAATPPGAALHEAVARASLTLLRNEGDLLPLLGDAPRVLIATLSDEDEPEAGAAFAAHLATRLRSRPETHVLDRTAAPAAFASVLEAAAEHDLIVVPAFFTPRPWRRAPAGSARQRLFLEQLLAVEKPVVMLSFGDPSVVRGLPRPPAAFVVAYGRDEAVQRVAAQALVGESGFHGRLPVDVSPAFAYGDGVQKDAVLPRIGYAEEAGMDGRLLAREDSLLYQAIEDTAFPGAAVAIGRENVIVKLQGYGYHTYQQETPVTTRSPFDLASLTKVIATTTASMLLYEQGRLDLDAPVARYLPAFGQHGKASITIRQLLTHSAGLAPFRPFHRMAIRNRRQVVDAIMSEEPVYEPGTDTRYSDLGIITLGLVIERITGKDLAAYCQEAIFSPLGMHDTGFREIGGGRDTTVVPTEHDTYFRNRLLQGEVHDETAYLMGGTSGHAGLFSTAEDLARFATMLVSEGRYAGRAFLRPETIRYFTTPVAPGEHSRALGWDTRPPDGRSSAGQRFGPRSFGHTGFTGTSVWIDPDQKLYAILLTNRVYPSRENQRHKPVRARFADLAFDALAGPPRPMLPGPWMYAAASP